MEITVIISIETDDSNLPNIFSAILPILIIFVY